MDSKPQDANTTRRDEHDPRTVSMWIKVVENIQNDPPTERPIYVQRHPIDLEIPETWAVEDFRVDNGKTIRFIFTVLVRRENKEFYPGLSHNYLRLDATARVEITPAPENARPQVNFHSSWFDPGATHAGALLRMGPLDAENNLYIDFNLQFMP